MTVAIRALMTTQSALIHIFSMLTWFTDLFPSGFTAIDLPSHQCECRFVTKSRVSYTPCLQSTWGLNAFPMGTKEVHRVRCLTCHAAFTPSASCWDRLGAPDALVLTDSILQIHRALTLKMRHCGSCNSFCVSKSIKSRQLV